MTERYHVFDPTGNITVLVEGERNKETADRVMKEVPAAQQVGFITENGKKLTMAGGEFCGNASMCAAVLNFEKTGEREAELTVSGASEKVRVRVENRENGYFCTVTVAPAEEIADMTLSYGKNEFPLTAVKMQGIIHLVMTGKTEKETAEAAARERCRTLKADALGLMYLDTADGVRLTPLVYVPGADTLFWESSCASGTCAVGAYLSRKNGTDISRLEIREPAGSLFVTATQDGTMKISGNVRRLQ